MKLLINEPPLQCSPTLAVMIGVNQAIFLQQMHYWVDKSHHKMSDGRYWIYNTIESWYEQMPFWSKRTIQRIIANLESKNLIISGCFNSVRTDRTKWYTINYKLLEEMSLEYEEKKRLEKEKSDIVHNNKIDEAAFNEQINSTRKMKGRLANKKVAQPQQSQDMDNLSTWDFSHMDKLSISNTTTCHEPCGQSVAIHIDNVARSNQQTTQETFQKTTTTTNSTTKIEEIKALPVGADSLCKNYNIDPSSMLGLINTYGEAKVLEKIQLMLLGVAQKSIIKNPFGWLITALKKDYKAPVPLEVKEKNRITQEIKEKKADKVRELQIKHLEEERASHYAGAIQSKILADKLNKLKQN